MTWTHIKHTLLGILIVLSLFLSFGLWSAGGELGEEEGTQMATQQTQVSLVERERVDVFSPYQFVYHDEGTMHLTRADTLHTFITENLQTVDFDSVGSIQGMDRAAFQELLSENQWVEFVYEDRLPIGLLEDEFDSLTENAANQTFNRVAFSLQQPNEFIFYDSTREQRITVEVENSPLENTLALIESDEFFAVEGMTVELQNQIIYLPNEPVEISEESYVIERLSPRLYTGSLFDNTSEVTPRQTGNIVRYIDLTTEVQHNQSNETIHYSRERSDLGEWTMAERFHESYEQLTQVENWTDSVRYEEYNEENQTFTFRRQIQGIPVFSDNGQDVVQLSVVEGGLRTLSVPLRIIQTPISMPEQTTEQLMTGEELMEQLNSLENLAYERLEDIRIGYRWNYVQSEEIQIEGNVVEFIPGWYMKVDGNWINVDRYVALQEGQNGF